MGAVKAFYHDQIVAGQTMADDEFLLHDAMEEAAVDQRASEVASLFLAAGSLRELNDLASIVLACMAKRKREVA